MGEEKLTKKQRKALEFRGKIEKQQKEPKPEQTPDTNGDDDSQQESSKKRSSQEESEETPKKKRKTRRGKKGKGVNGGKGPRFILFVGNLPYSVNETELVAHFKNANPDRIRLRSDKGIAFLEFDNDTKEIQLKMELALRMHHSTLRDRKINVELTVGGGGSSESRMDKLKKKNEKLLEQRKERIKTELTTKTKTKTTHNDETNNGNDNSEIHPSRMKLIQ